MGSALCLSLPSFATRDARARSSEHVCGGVNRGGSGTTAERRRAADGPLSWYFENCAAMPRAQNARDAERATADEASAENIPAAVASMPPVTKIEVGPTRR